MLISELEVLENIFDEVKVDNTFEEGDIVSLFETLGILIDSYVIFHILLFH